MSKYSISIDLGGKVYEGKGDTALKALQSLPEPVKIFNKAIITLKIGDKTRKMMLMPARVKRFWWKTAQPLLAKSFESGLMGTKA